MPAKRKKQTTPEGQDDQQRVVVDFYDFARKSLKFLKRVFATLLETPPNDDMLRLLVDFCDHTLPVFRKSGGDPKDVAEMLTYKSTAHALLGEWQPALNSVNDASAIVQELGNQKDKAAALDNLGSVYANMGDIPQAMKSFDDALKIYKEIADKEGEAETRKHINSACLGFDGPEQAVKFHTDILPKFYEVGYRENVAFSIEQIKAMVEAEALNAPQPIDLLDAPPPAELNEATEAKAINEALAVPQPDEVSSDDTAEPGRTPMPKKVTREARRANGELTGPRGGNVQANRVGMTHLGVYLPKELIRAFRKKARKKGTTAQKLVEEFVKSTVEEEIPRATREKILENQVLQYEQKRKAALGLVKTPRATREKVLENEVLRYKQKRKAALDLS